jgi:1,4-dihydroxy-2-naphthoate octaprenyltransferase
MQPSRSKRELWQAAIKAPIYSVAVLPVVVAAAAVRRDHGVLTWSTCGGMCLASCCILAWQNLRWAPMLCCVEAPQAKAGR